MTPGPLFFPGPAQLSRRKAQLCRRGGFVREAADAMKIHRAQQLVDTAARRRLTAGERDEWEAWLAAHPEERAEWEVEMRLSRVLGSLLASPVPSNFTHRVLAAVERETARQARPPARRSRLAAWWRRWQWAAGTAAALLVGAWFVRMEQQWQSRREVVRSVQALAAASDLPSVEMLQDFDAIYNLPGGPVPSVADLESALR